MTDLGALIDLERYALDQPGSAAYRVAVTAARDDLQEDGCAIVRDLLRPEAVETLNAEINDRKATTHYSTQFINPYFHTVRDAAFPDRHPINTFIERSSGFIPGDS